MAIVVYVLLLEVRQGTRTRRVLVRDTAHKWTDGGFDLLGLPPVGLPIVPADDDIIARLSA